MTVDHDRGWTLAEEAGAPSPGEDGARPVVLALVVIMVLFSGLAGCEKLSPEQRRAALHLPPPGFIADAREGGRLYNDYCLVCHGVGAMGSDKGPPLVHRQYRAAHHADLAFNLAVKNGVPQHHWHFGDMPPIKEVTPAETGHITAYVRREQRRAGID